MNRRTSIALAFTLLAATAVAADAGSSRGKNGESAGRRDAYQAVPNASTSGQPGFGWRYFTTSRSARAVVISPAGDYYFSRGEGPVLVRKGLG